MPPRPSSSSTSQAQLAERAGLYPFSVAKLEQGGQEPTWPTVLALAQALGVNCLAFSGEVASGDPPPQTPKRGPGRPKKQEAGKPEPTSDEGQAKVTTPVRKPARRPGNEKG
jgi:DNA-binding XRE family transcriptional regulator